MTSVAGLAQHCLAEPRLDAPGLALLRTAGLGWPCLALPCSLSRASPASPCRAELSAALRDLPSAAKQCFASLAEPSRAYTMTGCDRIGIASSASPRLAQTSRAVASHRRAGLAMPSPA